MSEYTTVDKTRLLDTMRSNRAEHHGIFLQAQDAYRAKVIQELDRRLAEARNGGRILLTFALPEPVDYTEQYDEAIARFEWHQGDQVDLDALEFRQYVLNKWGWERAFAASTMSYVGS